MVRGFKQVFAQSYKNRRGESKVQVMMTRKLAARIAAADSEAIEELVRVITALLEREERGE